jgi:hypothetical protein
MRHFTATIFAAAVVALVASGCGPVTPKKPAAVPSPEATPAAPSVPDTARPLAEVAAEWEQKRGASDPRPVEVDDVDADFFKGMRCIEWYEDRPRWFFCDPKRGGNGATAPASDIGRKKPSAAPVPHGSALTAFN